MALPIAEEGFTVYSEQGLSALTASQTAMNAGIAGGVSGGVTTGKLEGAFMGAAEALAFNMVGTALGPDPGDGFFSLHTGMVFLAHGLVGGLFSANQRGGFVSGFLAAGFGAAAGSAELPGDDPESITFNIVEHAAFGGIGSMLGGGKFGNGAATGAFGYLFNDLSDLWLGSDAHYSIEAWFAERDAHFRIEFQVGASRIDLAYIDTDNKTIAVYEIKPDSPYGHMSAVLQIKRYVAELTIKYSGYKISIGTDSLISRYYEPGIFISSRGVDGRYYSLSAPAGRNGELFYLWGGRDPVEEQIKQGLSHPPHWVPGPWPRRPQCTPQYSC